MGVTGELQINAFRLRLLEMEGLVVEQDEGLGAVDSLHQTRQGQPAVSHISGLAVFPADEPEGFRHPYAAVAQHGDSGLLHVADGVLAAADMFMVAHDGVDAAGGAELAEHRRHILAGEREDVLVEKVAPEEDEIGFLRLHESHQLLHARVVDQGAEVDIGGEEQAHLPEGGWFVDGELEVAHAGMAGVDGAGKGQQEGESSDAGEEKGARAAAGLMPGRRQEGEKVIGQPDEIDDDEGEQGEDQNGRIIGADVDEESAQAGVEAAFAEPAQRVSRREQDDENGEGAAQSRRARQRLQAAPDDVPVHPGVEDEDDGEKDDKSAVFHQWEGFRLN